MESLLEAIPYLLLGVVTGAYGILVGAGGGVILAPALLLFFNIEPAIAAGTSLVLVSVNSVSGTLTYKRTGLVDYRSGFLFSVAAVPGSVIAPLLLNVAAPELFNILFGLMLLILGIVVSVRPNVRERDSIDGKDVSTGNATSISNPTPKWLNFTVKERKILSQKGVSYVFRFNESVCFVFNVFLGFISSFFGTGGGFLRTPVLISGFGFPVQVAVATSIFALSIYSTMGAAVHAYLGNVDWYPIALWSGVGLIVGGQIGARLLEIVNGLWILRILLLVVILLGIQLIVQGVWSDSYSLQIIH